MLIPDASVAVKWYLPEGMEADISLAMEFQRRAEGMLFAPDLLLLEVGSGMLTRMRKGEADMAKVLFAARDLPRCVALSPLTESLIVLTLEIGAEMGHYPQDCLYLAQAVAEGRTLVTADGKFIRKAENSRWRDYVVGLPDALDRIG